jgi:hypothetical protein
MTKLDGQTFERLADQTRMGATAREMARMVLVGGETMHAVALRMGTIPQRVRLAVGSIHRIQASLTWSSKTIPAAVPERLTVVLRDFVAGLQALAPKRINAPVLEELQMLLSRARQLVARRHRPSR